MFAKKIVLAATALAALTATGLTAANAAPFEHRGPIVEHRMMVRDVHRPYAARARVFETLRLHRFVGIGEPYFFHGRYVVRVHDRFGRPVLVQVDPYNGAFIRVL